MAKRGETRPWRMTYHWLTARSGTETFQTKQDAHDAAKRQVRRPGPEETYDCLVVVTHREEACPSQAAYYRACPSCRDWTTWDIEHSPIAWRHENESRWCELAADDPATEPNMPPRWNESPATLVGATR